MSAANDNPALDPLTRRSLGAAVRLLEKDARRSPTASEIRETAFALAAIQWASLARRRA